MIEYYSKCLGFNRYCNLILFFLLKLWCLIFVILCLILFKYVMFLFCVLNICYNIISWCILFLKIFDLELFLINKNYLNLVIFKDI